MRFKPDQSVVCINGAPWYCGVCGGLSPGPAKDDIVTVEAYDLTSPDGELHIALKEYPEPTHGNTNSYPEKFFEPLVDDEVIKAELKEIFEYATIYDLQSAH